MDRLSLKAYRVLHSVANTEVTVQRMTEKVAKHVRCRTNLIDVFFFTY